MTSSQQKETEQVTATGGLGESICLRRGREIAAAAALAAAFAVRSGRVSCHPGAAGMAPARGADARRKARKRQKLARRKQR